MRHELEEGVLTVQRGKVRLMEKKVSLMRQLRGNRVMSLAEKAVHRALRERRKKRRNLWRLMGSNLMRLSWS
jgi:RNase P/RNase MRP subunit POP5